MPPRADLSKNIRLPKLAYIGHRFYFVTICCHERQNTFTSPERCEWLLDILRTESSEREFSIHAYCLMPDHLHFVAEGYSQTSDLLAGCTQGTLRGLFGRKNTSIIFSAPANHLNRWLGLYGRIPFAAGYHRLSANIHLPDRSRD